MNNSNKLRNEMKRIFIYCFDKWWVSALLSAIALALFFTYDNLWLCLLGFICPIVSMIFQLKKRRWMLGCLTGFIMGVYLLFCGLWIILQLMPEDRPYSKTYENRKEIQNIIGVKIPRFEVVDSRLVHMKRFDFEFEVQCTIEFKTMPDDNLYHKLDNICALTIPAAPDENSKYFYYSLESIGRCWTKAGNEYRYARNTDFGEKFLHSKDAYFYFTITKGSRTAKIRYGNY
jgi:hypothetical protein